MQLDPALKERLSKLTKGSYGRSAIINIAVKEYLERHNAQDNNKGDKLIAEKTG